MLLFWTLAHFCGLVFQNKSPALEVEQFLSHDIDHRLNTTAHFLLGRVLRRSHDSGENIMTSSLRSSGLHDVNNLIKVKQENVYERKDFNWDAPPPPSLSPPPSDRGLWEEEWGPRSAPGEEVFPGLLWRRRSAVTTRLWWLSPAPPHGSLSLHDPPCWKQAVKKRRRMEEAPPAPPPPPPTTHQLLPLKQADGAPPPGRRREGLQLKSERPEGRRGFLKPRPRLLPKRSAEKRNACFISCRRK